MRKRIFSISMIILLVFLNIPIFANAIVKDIESSEDTIYLDDLSAFEDELRLWLKDFDCDWKNGEAKQSSWTSSNENVLSIKGKYINAVDLSLVGIGDTTISVSNPSGTETASKVIHVRQNILNISEQDIPEVIMGDTIELFSLYSNFSSCTTTEGFSGDGGIYVFKQNGKWLVKGEKEGTYDKSFKYGNKHNIRIKIKVKSTGDFSIPSSMEIMKGKTEKIPINGNLGRTVGFYVGTYIESYLQWTSSDESVASVEDGEVKAKNAGKATITASFNGQYAHTCNITVLRKDDEPKVVLHCPDSINVTAGTLITPEDYGIYVTVNGKKYSIDRIYDINNDGDGVIDDFDLDCTIYPHKEYIACMTSSGGKSYIFGKKKGNTTFTVRFWYNSNSYEDNNIGDSFNKEVTVHVNYNKKFSANGWLYDIKRGVFKVKIQNTSNKAITIYSSGAKSIDKDYKKFDCKLALSNGSSTKIKPGVQKIVKFKVKSGTPWQKVKDETVYCTCKYNGKKYQVKINANNSYVKISGKWKRLDDRR